MNQMRIVFFVRNLLPWIKWCELRLHLNTEHKNTVTKSHKNGLESMYVNFKDGKSPKCHTGQYTVCTYVPPSMYLLLFKFPIDLKPIGIFGSWVTWSSRISKSWIQCNDARGQRTHTDQSFSSAINALDVTSSFSDCLIGLYSKFCVISFLIRWYRLTNKIRGCANPARCAWSTQSIWLYAMCKCIA